MLTLTGSNSPAALASTPARYIFGDELDRWATSAGSEGDPWALAQARTKTFFNRKLVAVSTPTVKGFSAIETMFNLGTREHWCHECPECHSYHEINFDDIKIQFTTNFNGGKKDYIVDEVNWACKSCGCLIPQSKMRRQPAKWVATNPAAKANGHRSFWLNGFASPWANWNEIALEFLQAKNDPERLKVVFNTTFGKLWEERGEIEDEETILSRRENYEADLPDGVVILTCGVDTQDNRLEYEVVGHGLYGETWGITRGVILGKPDNDTVWQRLDDVINRTYTFKDGKGLLVYLTCVDSGGHYTQEVYCACRERANRNVFAIRGIGGQDKPYTPPPKQAKITVDGRYIGQCWYYNLGVDAGKTKIMNALKVQEPGARYCHFPLNEDRGYNVEYFQGLLSERLVRRRSSGQDKYVWEKLPGHIRNEPLDCRNYAMAALSILNPDIEAERRRLFAPDQKQSDQIKKSRKRKQRERMDDW
jgi:phage terminase large subunit GpA-like protein